MDELISPAVAHEISNQEFLLDIFYSYICFDIKFEALMNIDDEHMLEICKNTNDEILKEIISGEYQSRHWLDVKVFGLG